MKQLITHILAASVGACAAALLTIQINTPVLPREYQVEVSELGCAFYDNSRHVGFIPADTSSQLYKLIINDNN